MRVLVTGAAGLLGAAIVDRFQRDAAVHAAARQDVDISDRSAVQAVMDRISPHVVINCAAYNDVDRAEGDAEGALRVNAFGVLALARACHGAGATLIHYSTDFVFDGETSEPYTEDDVPNPSSVYGSSKLLGDWFAADAPRHYVLRVESLFGGPGRTSGARPGSLGTIVNRIRAGEEVPVFVDRTVSPSFTPDVADATWRLVAHGAPSGTYHCVNTGTASWAAIAREAGRLLDRAVSMRELTLASTSLKAPRPRYCALSNARLAAMHIPMPTWQDALARFLGGGDRPGESRSGNNARVV